ncbi:MAG: rRNA pseudouridine synthase [Clostridia bacterium]|nr:rRNA pseudouridine synthase [Clostridia bacterium]
MLRLDRWLVTLGTGSRSEVQKLIRKGGVKVNGAIVTDPGKQVDERTAQLTVQGAAVDGRLVRHVMLHKPAGLLTAARDKKQPTVMDLLPDVYGAIGCMPVGRLDKDTTGLLLLTTDGEMNHRLLAPGRHVDKTYRATVDGALGQEHIAAFAAGMHIPADGKEPAFDALPAELTLEAPDVAVLTIREGKFHQVKRMFRAVGREVVQLHRLSFGALTLPDDLPEGSWRELTEDEIAALYRDAHLEVVRKPD